VRPNPYRRAQLGPPVRVALAAARGTDSLSQPQPNEITGNTERCGETQTHIIPAPTPCPP